MDIEKLNNWVVWDIDKKNPKRPYRAGGAIPADTTDPQTWATWDEVQYTKKIGLVITPGLIFVDLDHVIVEGELVNWAREFLDKLGASYVEISPSGDGLHCLIEGVWPAGRRNKKKISGTEAIEVYGTERYSTITGVPFENSKLTVKKGATKFLKNFMGKNIAAEDAAGGVTSGKTMREIRKAMKAAGKWPDADDSWKSEEDYKFFHDIAETIGSPDLALISEVYLHSRVIRDKVAARVDYHVARAVEGHVFNDGFEVDPDADDLLATVEELDDDIKIKARLQVARKVGVLELEKTMGAIKKEEGISKGAQQKMMAETSSAEGMQKYFKGKLYWVPNLGAFAEVFKDRVIYHSRSGFSQTVMSKSKWMKPDDVSKLLHTIPATSIVYRPNAGHKTLDADGNPAINTYRGRKFKSKGKKMPKTFGKTLDNLFSGQPEAKENFINWMASILQHGMRTGVAWGFYGAAGSGKGLVVDIFSRVLGLGNCSLNVSDTILQSSFNSYANATQLIHLNEITSDFHSRHGVAGRVKAMITDPFIQINQKNMPEFTVMNFANIIMNSNNVAPMELDMDDRRWNMIFSFQSLSKTDWWDKDKSYDQALGEVEELGAYLMKYKADRLMATQPMALSDAKEKVIKQTTPLTQQISVLINEQNALGLINFMDLDAEILGQDDLIEDITEAAKTGKWSNALLLEIFQTLRGDRRATIHDARKALIIPYIKGSYSVFKNHTRKAVRGYKF